MKITNRLGLPDALVRAISNDDYDRGDCDISVTQLLSPPRQIALIEAHQDELEEDAADRLYALLGQIAHGILERANVVDLAEIRHFISIGGWKISGKFDNLALDDSAVLSDYKLTSVWKIKSGECPSDWQEQLNILAELLTANDVSVKQLKIVALLRDWSKPEAMRDPSYPQSQVVVFDVPLWPRAMRIEFIERRVALHQAARQSLPNCTDGERWMKSAKWAVMKEGRIRAIRVFDTEGEALAWQAGQRDSGKMFIEHRPAEPTRCKFYCAVAPHCQQWQDHQAKTAGFAENQPQEDEVL